MLHGTMTLLLKLLRIIYVFDNQALPKPPNKKRCDYCKRDFNRNTGRMVRSADGLRYRWQCKDCLEDNFLRINKKSA